MTLLPYSLARRRKFKFLLLQSLILLLFFVLNPFVYAEGDSILINLPAYRLYLFHQKGDVKEYPIAIGHKDTPTPTGSFQIMTKLLDPIWWPPGGGLPVYPGDSNPLGSRWLGLNLLGYGIHGNNNPHSIGTSITRGCIRMYNQDVEYLFSMVERGTRVEIVYQQVELVERDPLRVILYPDVYRRDPDPLLELYLLLEREGLVQDLYSPAMKEITLDEGLNYLPQRVELFLMGEEIVALQEGEDLWIPSFFLKGHKAYVPVEDVRVLGGRDYIRVPPIGVEHPLFFRRGEYTLSLIHYGGYSLTRE